ncbi:MAG TPA: MoxR family ATPase [bacterium]|nr:MoxR family ATPase [bacterium]
MAVSIEPRLTDQTLLGHQQTIEAIFREVKAVLVGQEDMLLKLMVALLTRGHVLLEGVPGIAKTLTITALAQAIEAGYNRVQFTPDLLPADILGTRIYSPNDHSFHTRFGPVFTNFLLADEINRAPAKVQSALLEAMQERQVTIGEESYRLDAPFLVMATQNPIETEGTYPLPEAQLDRFMLKVRVGYPSKNDELEIVRRYTGTSFPSVKRVATKDDILSMQAACDQVFVDENVKKYVVELVYATRRPKDYGLDLGYLIEYGASPRASIYLTLGAKALAFIQGRGYVTPDDVKRIAMDVLRHRVILTYEADAEEMTSEKIIARILNTVKVP